MPNTLFQSENLTVRRFTTDDDAFIFELLNTPAWKQFIGDRNINTRKDAVNYIINGPQSLYSKFGYGLWLVNLKETDEPIGMCGLLNRDYLDHPDIGFAFMPGFEGKGFAYEACLATLQYAKETYAVEKLYAVTIDSNIRSQRLLERCGFVRDGFVTPPGEKALWLYALTLQ